MLQLFVFNPNEKSDIFPPTTAISIEEYLQTEPQWKPHLLETLLLFDKLSNNLNDAINNFGLLDFIVPQLKEIYYRLTDNKFGLLRTVTDNHACFFILEPIDGKIFLSELLDLPYSLSSYYPFDKSPLVIMENVTQKEALYEYVEKNRSALKPLPPDFIIEQLQDAEVGTLQDVESLQKQWFLGEELMRGQYQFIRSNVSRR
jgi:hypothetical protein